MYFLAFKILLHFCSLQEDAERANANFYIKYGDMRTPLRAEEVLMKQKHRLIWERRNGPLPTEDGLTLDK